jgi:hypothetical protein
MEMSHFHQALDLNRCKFGCGDAQIAHILLALEAREQ